ncbi:MAG: hypothetical protein JNM14_14335 [Ferruginibacter sp.]|nr:hypothetical protein [Ferruginibacter sp.]
MKNIFIAFFSCFSANIAAQTTVVDVGKANTGGTAPSNLIYAVGGVPMNNAKYVTIVEGSAFYYDAFVSGKIILSGGRMYDKIKLRLDLMDNSVQYISPEGTELVATTPIKTVVLYDAALDKALQFDHSDFIGSPQTEKGWYQLLDTGTAWLYKRHNKSIRENKPYGSATTEQYITTSYNYYLLLNSVLTPIKKIKALPDLLADKKVQLQEYISLNSLTGKSDKDYLMLVAYYNSLAAKK